MIAFQLKNPIQAAALLPHHDALAPRCCLCHFHRYAAAAATNPPCLPAVNGSFYIKACPTCQKNEHDSHLGVLSHRGRPAILHVVKVKQGDFIAEPPHKDSFALGADGAIPVFLSDAHSRGHMVYHFLLWADVRPGDRLSGL